MWPGRCLLCSGGLRDESEARRALASAEAERLLRESPADWRQQRAGSLASLNALAAGLATRIIEDLSKEILSRMGSGHIWNLVLTGVCKSLGPTPSRLDHRHAVAVSRAWEMTASKRSRKP